MSQMHEEAATKVLRQLEDKGRAMLEATTGWAKSTAFIIQLHRQQPKSENATQLHCPPLRSVRGVRPQVRIRLLALDF